LKKNVSAILLILIPIIVAGVVLWPTFRASQLEGIEKEYIAAAEQAKRSAKDSIQALFAYDSVMAVFNKEYGEAYRSAKNNRIKLGLDLRGGMYVTLELDIAKLIEESAMRDAVDDVFMQVIDSTKAQAKVSDVEVLEIFLANFTKYARPRGKTLISYFNVGDVKDLTEEKIIEKLKASSDEAINQAQEVIRQRIDKYGVTEPTLNKQGTRRIVLELPGVTDETEMRQLLQTTARLEFKLVRNTQDLVSAFYRIDAYLSKRDTAETKDLTAQISDAMKKDTSGVAKADSTAVANDKKANPKDSSAIASKDSTKKTDSAAKTASAASDTSDPYAGLSEEEKGKRYQKDHPFTTLFLSYYINKEQYVPIGYVKNQFPEGDYFFQIPEESIEKVERILARSDVKRLMPADLSVAIGAKADSRIEKREGVKIFELFGVKRDPELTGEAVSDARATFDPTSNQPIVLMEMDDIGRERWARITGANIKKRIGIVLDERIYSAPTVQNKITGGSSQITGMADINEARLLEIVLKAGSLKAPVQIIEERVVGPSLGEDSIRSGITSFIIAISLVILFMIIYYAHSGAIADLAVAINVLLIISALSAFQGTLSLPGIAGIILTIGMAVDANILVFERIREELYRGRSMRAAIDEGFSKALSAILDSNITTFMTGMILYFFGSGPIQGFAITLMIGIITTLFTALTVSRALINLSIGDSSSTRFSFGQVKHITTT
jgi:SecD/SecF fusion protein